MQTDQTKNTNTKFQPKILVMYCFDNKSYALVYQDALVNFPNEKLLIIVMVNALKCQTLVACQKDQTWQTKKQSDQCLPFLPF